MLACHAGGPGSIPGRCKSFFRPFLCDKCQTVSLDWHCNSCVHFYFFTCDNRVFFYFHRNSIGGAGKLYDVESNDAFSTVISSRAPRKKLKRKDKRSPSKNLNNVKKKFVFFVHFIFLNKWTAWAFSWMVAPSSGELGNWKKFSLQLSQNFTTNHVFFVWWSLFF